MGLLDKLKKKNEEDKIITITLWGNGYKYKKWKEWYIDMKYLFQNNGYPLTHIGILSESYTDGKILTVSRKEKEILENISSSETPKSMSCYSLPKDYKIASFDYDFLCSRSESNISVIMRAKDYNQHKEKMIVDGI